MKLMFAQILFLMLVFPAVRAQETYSVEACFDSYVQGTYCFVDMEGTTFQFQDIEPSAMEKYDLTDASYQGKMFIVVYQSVNNTKEEREEDEAYEQDNNGEDYEEDGGQSNEGEDYEEDEGENDDTGYQAYSIVDLELIG